MSGGRRESPYGSYSAWSGQGQQGQQRYGQQQQQGQQQGRRGSFDQGDDSVIAGNPPPRQQSYQAYHQNQNASQFPDMRSQSYRSYTGSASGPSQQQQPLGIQTQSTYNPANYAPQSSTQPYNPGLPGSPTSHIQMPAGNYAAAHVPYNPAAYSANPSPQTAQTGFSYQAYHSSTPLSSYSSNQMPPLPPKPPELAQQSAASNQFGRTHSERRGGISTASPSEENRPSQFRNNSSPAISYSAYTPPAPPPPPSHASPTSSNFPSSYLAYQPPQIAQPQHSAPAATTAPLQHRRLPSIPQGTTSPPMSSQSWAPRVQGASIPSPDPASSTGNTSAPATSRPLPAPPGADPSAAGRSPAATNDASYDDIFAEVEAAVMGRPGSIGHTHSQTNHVAQGTSANGLAQRPSVGSRGDSQRLNNSSQAGTVQAGASSGDDSITAAGLEAIRLMEQELGRNASTRTNDTSLTGTTVGPGGDVSRNASSRSYASANTVDSNATLGPGLEDADDSDSDIGIGIDISGFGGGFDPGMNFGYGGTGPPVLASPPLPTVQTPPVTHSPRTSDAISPPLNRASNGSTAGVAGHLWGDEAPASAARVDMGGTGGFIAPEHQRRMSFEENDEEVLMHDDPKHASSRSQSGQGVPGRPLPPTPEDKTHLSPHRNNSHDGGYPQAPDGYGQSSYEGPDSVRKTNSLNYQHGNQLLVPGRSITDAEQRRKAGFRGSYYVTEGRDPAFPAPGELDLPEIPDGRRRKFVPSKLSSRDFALCTEPWAVSNILAWLKEMASGEQDLRQQPLVDALIGLFTHKVPTMNIADAEVLGASLIEGMISEAAILREEEWVKFSDLEMTGVVYQLTGSGCYSPRAHTTAMQGRCYSHHCMRTLKKIDLQAQQLPPERKAQDWATFYGFKSEDMGAFDKKEIELQNNLHEIVTSEDYFIDQLDVLLVLYRDGLAKSAQPIIALTGKQGKFISEVFDKVPAVKKANEDYLLAQLKYRQQEQGPWITGFSDIFREWIRRAKSAYIDYAYNLPNAIFKVKTQCDQNVLFKQFLDQVREHPRSKRLDWNTYLKAPVTRLQRYGLLLETVKKNMRTEAHAKERANLEIAIKEIKAVTLECDTKVDEMTKQTDMQDLTTKLKLRPGMEHVQLNLNHLGRTIVYRGDLMRRSANNMSWVENHAILFDHFMILSKPTRTKDSSGGIKAEYYDVSKLPIPMDLLVLESADDGMVQKHSVKGIIPMGTTQVSRPSAPSTPNLSLNRVQTSQSATSMPQAARTNSIPATPGGAGGTGGSDENIMFPFRVQHLGKSEVYVLYAPTASARTEWVDSIITAKEKHAMALHAQNAEPFKLRVLADTSFAYGMDSPGGLGVHIAGTPLDRALRDVEREHPLPAQISPICRSAVNCATTFKPHLSERTLLAVGTDFGVFITDDRAPRSWYKAINATHVTQIQVLEDFSVLLIIADKALIAFHLDAVVPPPNSSGNDNSAKRTPQKLSGNRDVGFFAVGRMKDRMLVFYKKRDGISSTFKVLEPVYQKTATSTSTSSGWGRSRFGLKKGNTDFFRDFDDFYIATDTYGLNLFASSLAVASARGIEVLNLDKKLPISIPDLRAASVESIAARLQGQRPLGMYRLNDQEFLLVFEEIGIYVDKHGDVSRAVVMEFVGRARQAALHRGMYLVLVDSTAGFVEVRNANNGRLRQVISGRDVRMLDDGMGAGMSLANAGTHLTTDSNGKPVPAGFVAGQSRGTVKISMQHPEIDRGAVVLEMLMNEGISE